LANFAGGLRRGGPLKSLLIGREEILSAPAAPAAAVMFLRVKMEKSARPAMLSHEQWHFGGKMPSSPPQDMTASAPANADSANEVRTASRP